METSKHPVDPARSTWCAWLLAIGLLWSAQGRAQAAEPQSPQPQPESQADQEARETAQRLADEAYKRFQDGDYTRALERYRQALAIVDVPAVRVRIARSLDKLGKLIEAAEEYVRVIRADIPPEAPEAHRKAKTDAEAEHAAILKRIPAVVVRLKGHAQGATLVLDGQPLPSAVVGVKYNLDPGEHRLEVQRDGKSESSSSFRLTEGEVLELEMKLGAQAKPPGIKARPTAVEEGTDWKIPVGGALLGLGGAGLIVGAVTGGLALGKKSDLVDACGEAIECPPPQHDDVDSYNTLRMVSGVSFIVGGVVAAAGITILIVGAVGGDEPSDAATASLRARMLPGGIALEAHY